MKFTCVSASFIFINSLLAASSATPNPITFIATYDTAYDNPDGQMSSAACSDGSNGLITKGFNNFGSLPGFPHIGGAAVVQGYDSSNCGTCWELKYESKNVETSLSIFVIDSAAPGTFNIAKAAMDHLTGGQSVHLGKIVVSVAPVDDSWCGYYP